MFEDKIQELTISLTVDMFLVVLWEDDGLPVKARVKEVVLSIKVFLCSHFVPPTCCSIYCFWPNFLPHDGQENDIDLESSLGGSRQLAWCLVKPEALRKNVLLSKPKLTHQHTWCTLFHTSISDLQDQKTSPQLQSSRTHPPREASQHWSGPCLQTQQK